MGIMLPTATDNGARLAAILPTGLLTLCRGLGLPPDDFYAEAIGGSPDADQMETLTKVEQLVPALRSFVIIVVDGLGTANLKARAGHAPTLSALQQRRITTVTPSTTAAALTTLTTGRLPAEHGLVGYRIMHPELGLITPLRDWAGIDDVRSWQHSDPLFGLASRLGARAIAFGRPAHASSGFTRAMLAGAEFVGGARIADRFVAAKRQLMTGQPTLAYVYVDELDRAGHHEGWESDAWSRRLEQLDSAVTDFLSGLPSDVGVAITADHGMVDVARHQQVVFDLAAPEFADVSAFGGEPRFRSFYLREGVDPHAFLSRLEAREGKRAWVCTREEALASGLFGEDIAPGVYERLGSVLLAARGQVAYYSTDDDPKALEMVGQHGSWSDEERGIPLMLAGALAGTGFARAVEAFAG